MDDRRAGFLAGDRTDDVVIYLSNEAVDDPAALAGYGETVDDGVVLVLDGERGRSVFQTATGTGVMEFAGRAGDREGRVHADLTGGDCPDAGADGGDGTGDPEEDAAGDAVDEAGGDDGEDATGEDATGDAGDDAHRARIVFAFAEARQPDADDRYGEGDVIHAYARCSCGTAYSDWWHASDR